MLPLVAINDPPDRYVSITTNGELCNLPHLCGVADLPNCRHVSMFKVNQIEHHAKPLSSGFIFDPEYNLPLWTQTENTPELVSSCLRDMANPVLIALQDYDSFHGD
ncbi:hypothetical protein PLANTIT3_70138 [Plantibacter sp. T3]|nr:hypothetical protein PLANTIT3_70138 [Plantibacter sp. T3]